MSQLSTWTGKAKTTIKQADQIRLKDTDDTDSLRRLIDSNGRLMHSDRTGLSENESERLAAKADKATKRTRTLTNKIGRLVKEKPLTDAKNKCHTALDKASKAPMMRNHPTMRPVRRKPHWTSSSRRPASSTRRRPSTRGPTWPPNSTRPAKTSPAHWTRKPRPTRRPNARPKRRSSNRPRRYQPRHRRPRRNTMVRPAAPAPRPCPAATMAAMRTMAAPATAADRPAGTPAGTPAMVRATGNP